MYREVGKKSFCGFLIKQKTSEPNFLIVTQKRQYRNSVTQLVFITQATPIINPSLLVTHSRWKILP